MKIPRIIKWGFDPVTSSILGLHNMKERLLWGIIRTNHIVSQNFNKSVHDFIKDIEKYPPKDFEDFIARVQGSDLSCFGVISSEPNYYGRLYVIDREYWLEIYEALEGKLEVKEEIIKD